MAADDYPMGALADESSYDPFAAETFVHPAVAAQAKYMAGQDVDTFRNIGGAIEHALDIPRIATQNSQFALGTGTYDPRPAMEGALLTLGGSATVKPGEMLLGAGVKPRTSSVLGDFTVSRGPPRWAPPEEIAAAPPPPAAMGDTLRPNTYADPKLRAKAEKIWNTYPQYAEEYPAVGPPSLMEKRPDPKRPGRYLSDKPLGEVPYTDFNEAAKLDATPRYFFEKKLLPEVELFQKQRNTVQKDMDLHGYEPYFDPTKRADVDTTGYAPFVDTATAAAPKTAATDQKFYEKYGTPEARARLQEGYEKGQTIPNAENWYFMKQLEDAYVNELGPAAGKDAFRKEFSGMMAATTGGASPYENFLMSHYANYLNKQGENVAQRAYQMSFPIGGRYASGNMKQAQKYIEGGMQPFDPAKNPKRYDFDNALAGDRNAGVIDEQMSGAYVPGMTIPEWYGPATRILREEAAKVGTDPRAFQDVGWAGLKALKTEAATGKPFVYEGPMINQINRSIETTHRLTGMPKDEIVRRGLIRKEIPMYGLAGAGAAKVMGDMARQDEYQ